MEEQTIDIGANIRRLRGERGISQDELAKRIHVSRPSITAYEQSKSEPSVSTLIQISRVLNVSLDMLVGNAREFKKVVVLDTSVLLNRPVILGEVVERFDEVIVPRVVISELNHQKDLHKNNNRAWLVMNDVQERQKKGEVRVIDCTKKDGKNDERIFAVAVERAQETLADKVYMFSNDIDFAFFTSNVPNLERLTFRSYAAMFSEMTSSDPIKSQIFFSKIRTKNLGEAKEYYKYNGTEIDVNMVDPETGLTPLIQAVRNHDFAAVEYLVGLPGIDLDAKDNHKYFFTPLLHAAQIKEKTPNIFRCLVENGADYDAGSGGNNAGNTPLMVCAWGGYTEGIKILLEYDVSFNQQDSNGYTALTKACIRKHYDIAAMLIEKTDVKIRSRENKRADDYIDLKDIAARGLISKFSEIRKSGRND